MTPRTITMEFTHREAGIMLHLLAGALARLPRTAAAHTLPRPQRRKLGQYKMLWRRIRTHRKRIG